MKKVKQVKQINSNPQLQSMKFLSSKVETKVSQPVEKPKIEERRRPLSRQYSSQLTALLPKETKIEEIKRPLSRQNSSQFTAQILKESLEVPFKTDKVKRLQNCNSQLGNYFQKKEQQKTKLESEAKSKLKRPT